MPRLRNKRSILVSRTEYDKSKVKRPARTCTARALSVLIVVLFFLSLRYFSHAPRTAPLHVWQTAKSLQVGARIAKYRKEWIESNAHAEFHLLDDAMVRKWVRRVYGDSTLKLFDSLPLAVMRADWWRYMVIAEEGGLYLDADVKMKYPVQTWPEFPKCHVILGMEIDYTYASTGVCNWAFYARKGHPLMRHVVRYIESRIRHTDAVNVHVTTGPIAFTNAIREYLNISETFDPPMTFYQRIVMEHQRRNPESTICFVGKKFRDIYVSNMYSSQWPENSRSYSSWIQDDANRFHVWQTAKSLQVGARIAEYRKEWIESNAHAEFHLLDDAIVHEWVRRVYGDSTLKLFDSLPLAVMRADWWRYMVIAEEGGLYLDADVKMVRPIREWLNVSACDVVIGKEKNSEHLCNWAFYARKGHPLMRHIVEYVKSRLESGIVISEHFVHAYTGPGVFTSAVRAYEGDRTRICFLDEKAFYGQYLSNTFSSQWLRDSREGNKAFESWITQRDRLIHATLTKKSKSF